MTQTGRTGPKQHLTGELAPRPEKIYSSAPVRVATLSTLSIVRLKQRVLQICAHGKFEAAKLWLTGKTKPKSCTRYLTTAIPGRSGKPVDKPNFVPNHALRQAEKGN